MPEEAPVLLYRRTQIGYVPAGLMLAATATVGALLLAGLGAGARVAMAVVLVLLLVVLATFTRLTVAVTPTDVRWHFGAGWPGRQVPIADVATAESVRNPWWYGWGIRLTPAGVLWNVSGTAAVEIRLKSGGRFRIGTDESETLAGAIERAMRLGTPPPL